MIAHPNHLEPSRDFRVRDQTFNPKARLAQHSRPGRAAWRGHQRPPKQILLAESQELNQYAPETNLGYI